MANTNTVPAALVAPAFAMAEASRFLPASDKVRIYFRTGRRYTRVFWAYAGSESGSILVFVENVTGRVYLPKSSTKVGHATELVWV